MYCNNHELIFTNANSVFFSHSKVVILQFQLLIFPLTNRTTVHSNNRRQTAGGECIFEDCLSLLTNNSSRLGAMIQIKYN